MVVFVLVLLCFLLNDKTYRSFVHIVFETKIWGYDFQAGQIKDPNNNAATSFNKNCANEQEAVG